MCAISSRADKGACRQVRIVRQQAGAKQGNFVCHIRQIVDQQDARVLDAIAEHQRANVVVLGHEHALLLARFNQKSEIARIGIALR